MTADAIVSNASHSFPSPVPTGKSVLVTGGTGYVAGWMIAGLLQRGYRVRTTVRNLSAEATVRKNLAGQCDPGDRLRFHAADLLRDAGWSAAAAGCDFVIHVASPMGQGAPEGTDLVTPAREGTVRILKAAAAAGVQRVVITSSVIASQPASQPAPSSASGKASADAARDKGSDESVWTDINGKDVSDYARSKTLAEQAAWDFIGQDQSDLTLTTILPGMILGPVMTPKVAGSVEVVARMLTGKMPAIPRLGFSIVDVRDLVQLHIDAMESPEAAGQRLIAANEFLWLGEIAELLRAHPDLPKGKLPTRRLPDFILRLSALFSAEAKFMAPLLGRKSLFSHAKAASLLGWQPRGARQTVIDCAQSLVRQGAA